MLIFVAVSISVVHANVPNALVLIASEFFSMTTGEDVIVCVVSPRRQWKK